MENLALVLDEVMGGLAESLQNDGAAESYFDHPAARACKESSAFHNMLVDMSKAEGIRQPALNRVAWLVQFAVVSGYLLREAETPQLTTG